MTNLMSVMLVPLKSKRHRCTMTNVRCLGIFNKCGGAWLFGLLGDFIYAVKEGVLAAHQKPKLVANFIIILEPL